MLRVTKILLIAAVSLWGFVGALYNATNWAETTQAVGAVTSMSAFEGGAESPRATASPLVIFAGALLIMSSKLLAGILCLVGAARMWRARRAAAPDFAAAKTLAVAGCGIAMFMLFAGFILVAETWFELWRSDAMRGVVLDSAFRYGAMIVLIALFVAQDND